MSINPLSGMATGESCDCYECVGEEYAYTDDGHRYITNNLKKHTFLEPCKECGKPKTEHLDLSRKGYYICWWCSERTGRTDEPHENPIVDIPEPIQAEYLPQTTGANS